MLLVFLALWATAGILWVLNPGNKAMRWLGAVAVFGGCGALAAVIGDTLLPGLEAAQPAHFALPFLRTLEIVASICSYYFMPYSFLVFAMHYNRTWIPDRWKNRSTLLFLLPIVVFFLFTPVYTVQYPELYVWLSLWCLPYVAAGTILVLTRKEEQKHLRRMHALTDVVVLTPVVYSSIMNYLMPSLGYYEMWRYNTWMVLFAVALFLFALLSYGFMGVRLLVRKRQLDYTLRTITSGTAILNHAIKNDLGKIQLFSAKIKRQTAKTGEAEPEWLADVAVIQNAAAHIERMINRIHQQTRDMTVKLRSLQLTPLIQDTLYSLSPQLEAAQVRVNLELAENLTVEGDSAHLEEVLQNVICNAIEAMQDLATARILLIASTRHKREMVIRIEDNGSGITETDLSQVTEPFFTTKAKSGVNFGLGLAYCKQVMHKHGGTLRIQSQGDAGTTVFLHFPIS